CRAGTNTVRPFPVEEFATHANIADLTLRRALDVQNVPHEPWDDGLGANPPVGRLLPNAFGLYDVLGSLWEWCLDGHEVEFYATSPSTDPVCPFSGADDHVLRGGGFTVTGINARSAARYYFPPPYSASDLGVRPTRAITD
ncbi:MAG: sulfatase modifying factor 1, partial [Planctomycetota bacterium]